MKHLCALLFAVLIVSTGDAESLWLKKANGESGMYADRRANNVGDILMVVVDETTSVSSSISKNSSQTSKSGSGINSFFFDGLLTRNGDYPAIQHEASKSFGGSGSVSNTQRVLSRAAVIIVDVLPNGNLIVEGAKKLEVSGEEQVAILRGIVRKDDVMADNSVLSSRIANAEVEVVTKGAMGASQRRGLVTRIFDFINIF